jgi:hypothetical protein
MTIELEPAVESALRDQARERGVSAETLAAETIRDRFRPPSRPAIIPQDEWEQQLLALGVDCGVSLTDEQLTRESLYE